MVLSASSVTAVLRYGVNPYYFFIKQILFVFIGYFIGFVIILRIDTYKYKKYIPILLISLAGILLWLILYGSFTGTAKSWIDLGLFSFQPSEVGKSILIIYMGVFFGDQFNKKPARFSFLIPLIYAIIIFILVAMQPDLGTAAIIGGIIFFTFISIPFKKNTAANIAKIGSGALVCFALVFLFTGNSFLTEEQSSRLDFKEPCVNYTSEIGYQVCNGFIAVNNGGLFGKGLGNSSQKYLYLPEAHTDFIFPILVEELGAVVASIVIIGYLAILYRILLIAKKSYNLRNSIICYGTFIYILMHLILNFCGILALIPLTGVPVPFLSYGGTFTINLLLMIFVVLKISSENKITKEKQEISNI